MSDNNNNINRRNFLKLLISLPCCAMLRNISLASIPSNYYLAHKDDFLNEFHEINRGAFQYLRSQYDQGTAKYITINQNKIWTQRLSYVGELGFELYINMNESKEIYNLIVDKGKEFKLSHCGMFAMDTMRMEKGYLHWGHDISPEENQYEAGLGFAISYKKNI